MDVKELTPEQLRQFEAIVDEFEKCRGMSQEEKQLLVKQIMSDTFMDLRCDWALSQVEDKAHYHKYIVITSNSSNHILNI